MSRQNYLGIFGHVALDVLITVDNFPEPNTCGEVKNRKTLFGGTGANLAVAASRLGVKSAIASFVGDDFPTELREFMTSLDIDLKELVTVEGGRTPTIIMVSDGSHNQIGFVDQGVMREQDKLPFLEHTIVDSEVVHVGTGRPGYALQVCDRARRENKIISFDPAQELSYVYSEEQFNKILPFVDIFFCNEKELEIALRYTGLSEPEALLSTINTLVITRGASGSSIISKEAGPFDIPSFKPERVVDTTGAGDSYRAGFYAAMSRGMSLEECGQAGSAASSFAVEEYGGQTSRASWEDVYRRAFGGKIEV